MLKKKMKLNAENAQNGPDGWQFLFYTSFIYDEQFEVAL